MNELGLFIKENRESKGLSKRALADAANISHTEIHRIENGQRQNPSPPLLRAIAAALGVQYESLMEKAGYINNINELTSSHANEEFEEKFMEILMPKLIKDGWTIEPCSPSSIADLLARKNETTWNFDFRYFNESKSKVSFNKNVMFNTYGKLASYDGNQITKFTIVTNNENVLKIYNKFAPINLIIKISCMLVDFESNKIIEEIELN